MQVLQVNNQIVSQSKLNKSQISMTGKSPNLRTNISTSKPISKRFIDLYLTVSKIVHSLLDFLNPNVRHFYDENNRLIRIDHYNVDRNGHKFKIKRHYENGKFSRQELYDPECNGLSAECI